MRGQRAGVTAKRRRVSRLAVALLCSLALPAFAETAPTVEELQKRLEALERRQGQRTQQRDRQPRHPPLPCRHARSLSTHCRSPEWPIGPEATMLRMHMHAGK